MNETTIDPSVVLRALQQRLLTIQVLDVQHTKMETWLAAIRKKWADKLGEDTEQLNIKIRDVIPARAGDAKGRIEEIQGLDRSKQDDKLAKDKEIEEAKAAIAVNRAAFYDVIRCGENLYQMNLDFTGDGDLFDPRAGVTMEAKHVDTVRQAVESIEGDEDNELDGLADLRSRLDEIGAAGLSFPDVGDDVEDAEADEPEEGASEPTGEETPAVGEITETLDEPLF